jgi:hypothetical protein
MLSIIIPVFSEAENLPVLLEKLEAVLNALGREDEFEGHQMHKMSCPGIWRGKKILATALAETREAKCG